MSCGASLLSSFLANVTSLGPGASFSELRGRIFPMVGLGVEAVIEANFGADLEAAPFRYPEGRDMKYNGSKFD